MASIDTSRCLVWGYNTICSVCEEICPLAEKAIRLEEMEVENARGDKITVQRPFVLRELCIGCGACEYHCPIGGEAAIRVETLPSTDVFLRGI